MTSRGRPSSELSQLSGEFLATFLSYTSLSHLAQPNTDMVPVIKQSSPLLNRPRHHARDSLRLGKYILQTRIIIAETP